MTIRSTVNQSISTAAKQKLTVGDPAAYTGIKGESWELVGSDTGILEARDIDIRVAGQTELPADGFNGTYE